MKKTESLSRQAYFGWSLVVLAVFALLAPVAQCAIMPLTLSA